MRKIIVDENFSGKTLNSFLNYSFPYLKQNMFFKALRKKDIKVNGQRVKENILVNNGDIIEVYISDEHLLGNVVNFDVVYEDNNILAINKR